MGGGQWPNRSLYSCANRLFPLMRLLRTCSIRLVLTFFCTHYAHVYTQRSCLKHIPCSVTSNLEAPLVLLSWRRSHSFGTGAYCSCMSCARMSRAYCVHMVSACPACLCCAYCARMACVRCVGSQAHVPFHAPVATHTHTRGRCNLVGCV